MRSPGRSDSTSHVRRAPERLAIQLRPAGSNRWAGLLCGALLITGCGTTDELEIWAPPPPLAGELDRGLVVLYPGATNSTSEMYGFYTALQEGGVDRAIEIERWSPPLLYFFNPSAVGEWIRPWAKSEAARLAKYQDDHPGMPVALVGYSGGALAATIVAEEMPGDHSLDCVVLMSPGMAASYDLMPMLGHTRIAISYWSAQDVFAIVFLATYQFLDVELGRPAATYGFDLEDPRLTQVQWDSSMLAYGNAGDHIEYLGNLTWLRDYLAAWILHGP